MKYVTLTMVLLLGCVSNSVPIDGYKKPAIVTGVGKIYTSPCNLAATDTLAFVCHNNDERFEGCVPSADKCLDEEIVDWLLILDMMQEYNGPNWVNIPPQRK